MNMPHKDKDKEMKDSKDLKALEDKNFSTPKINLQNLSLNFSQNKHLSLTQLSPGHEDECSLNSSFDGRGSSASSELKIKPDFSRLCNSTTEKDLAKIAKRETLKLQKINYKHEKKKATNELISTLQDPSVIIISDWLKVRGSLKSWTKLFCVLKPGLLFLYKSEKTKSSYWVATVLLNTCEVLERPSKKDGFCFKIFHPLEQSIWASKGPKGENIGAITQPFPFSYLIFRAPSEAAGKCWMDALELALHCSSTVLIRSMTKELRMISSADGSLIGTAHLDSSSMPSLLRQQLDESDCERHFNVCGLDEDIKTDKEDKDDDADLDTDTEDEQREKASEVTNDDKPPIETNYVENIVEELGQLGDACQTEEVADENKSIIWTLVKQVRPGMDLSKVALPTFILEPRSFLDKLSDYYYHADIISEAVLIDDPYTRIKTIVKWYFSGFYKKPKGLKKPYNPILGETFRCYWKHAKSSSRTFYMAEQISHHPPVSAFYVSNRHDGFALQGSILAKSKFYGNSLSAILDGVCRLVLLNRGEEYAITMPYAHCKGILIGTLTMEFGGLVSVHCEKTGYKAEMEFKLKPFLGIGEASNRITGKIKLGDETLATLDGHWDQEIYITEKRSGKTELFWSPTPEIRAARLIRYTVNLQSQSEFESEKMWSHVSEAIAKGDQNLATNEKSILEEQQRRDARERKMKMQEWSPRFFERNHLTGDWMYKYADWRPWDQMNDVIQFEYDYIIRTKTHHQTPIVHTTSITNMEEKANVAVSSVSNCNHSRHSSMDIRVNRIKRIQNLKHLRSMHCSGNQNSHTQNDRTLDNGQQQRCDSESSLSPCETPTAKELVSRDNCLFQSTTSNTTLQDCIDSMVRAQSEVNSSLMDIKMDITTIKKRLEMPLHSRIGLFSIYELSIFVFIACFLQTFVIWILR